ncbi:MAG: PD-(D/E)XK nuclease-like domain-containing protein [Streptococcus sp.]
MIAALEKEELFNRLYHGTDDELVEKERIITGTLEGIPFKCKIDSLNLSGGYFVDLKTMESLQSENIRRHFIVLRSLFSITL